jgi:hypothetical protein
MLPLVVIVYTSALVGLLLIAGLAAWQHQSFLKRTPKLRSKDDLKRFKRLAAWNMYGALLCIVLIVLVIGALGVSLVAGLLTWKQNLLLLVIASVLLSLAGGAVKPIERKVKRIPAADDKLAAARDDVVHIWDTKPFPTW